MITKQERRKERGSALLAELIGAMLVLTLAIMPITVMLLKDQRACREYYYKAVAMEIVDGEMEILAAGGVGGISEGSQPYAVNAAAATNLPPGKFTLTREGKTLRLEWQANEPLEHLRVNREILLP